MTDFFFLVRDVNPDHFVCVARSSYRRMGRFYFSTGKEDGRRSKDFGARHSNTSEILQVRQWPKLWKLHGPTAAAAICRV